DLEAAVTLFAGLPSAEREAAIPPETWGGAGGERHEALLGGDLRFWAVVARFILSLLARQRYIPSADILPPQESVHDSYGYWSGPTVAAVWRGVLADPDDRAHFERLVGAMPPLCLAALDPTNGSHSEAP